MAKRAIYAGTFDPLTLGHVDLIQRAQLLFDEVIVAVAENPKKTTLFTFEERLQLVQSALVSLPHVKITGFTGLLYEFAKKNQAAVLLRGLRSYADFEYETQMAGMNHHFAPHIETVFLTPAEKFRHVSSTLIREIASLHGDVSSFLPKECVLALKEKFKS